jgi:Fe2+ transport system protein FeoA
MPGTTPDGPHGNLPIMPGTIPDGAHSPSKPGKKPARAPKRERSGTDEQSDSVPDSAPRLRKAQLSELKPGESGVIANLRGNAQGRLRLMEMGLTPGAHVKVLHAAAFGGPIQICIRGYQLSLRREEASAVVLG